MKKLIRFLMILMAAMLLFTSAAQAAAGPSAGDMAEKIAGTYDVYVGDTKLPFQYKIERSGKDMKMSAFTEDGNLVSSQLVLNSDVTALPSTLNQMVYREVDSIVTMTVRPNGDVEVLTIEGYDMTTTVLKKISTPDTGDTTNAPVAGMMMLVAAAGMIAAKKYAK